MHISVIKLLLAITTWGTRAAVCLLSFIRTANARLYYRPIAPTYSARSSFYSRFAFDFCGICIAMTIFYLQEMRI
jgi:hypothetical protein